MVAPFFGLIIHIQGTDHAHVHVNELCGEVKVTLQIGRINDVDDNIGRLLDQLFTYI